MQQFARRIGAAAPRTRDRRAVAVTAPEHFVPKVVASIREAYPRVTVHATSSARDKWLIAFAMGAPTSALLQSAEFAGAAHRHFRAGAVSARVQSGQHVCEMPHGSDLRPGRSRRAADLSATTRSRSGSFWKPVIVDSSLEVQPAVSAPTASS